MGFSERPPDREVLAGGPARAPLLDRLPPAWRRRGALVGAVALGVVVGVGTALWWQDPPREATPEPAPTEVADPEVRLVLVRVVAPARPQQLGDDQSIPLRIDGALLHGRGPGTATVTRIHRPGSSLAIDVPALPVELSADRSSGRVRLELTPGDCGLATEWTPSARPFTVTWRDELGDVRTGLGGEHDASMELAMIRYLDVVCGNAGDGL
ncbi:hypothetical protein [Nocardioides euryhalodurans]|uniref:Uncharacterized protein n=1 Tax=Nocardioides euryhalodurans TaxID=2518370 RepID=A0A4V1BE97_9ACTN|nr:hypothetical protein [Nocardioides euryhalodurans]QBR93862.1 hypothetical protein EXE57_17415 [Nocardioides euryhalodurans]